MNCEGCGCGEFDACVDEATGETCGWASIDPPVCSFCAMIALDMHERAQVRRSKR